jgi:hypothetical protein
VQWHLIVTLTFISLINDNVEHLSHNIYVQYNMSFI